MLFATVPFFVAILAHFVIPEERLNSWKLLGVLISFVGLVIIFSGQLILTERSVWGGVVLLSGAQLPTPKVFGGMVPDIMLLTTGRATIRRSRRRCSFDCLPDTSRQGFLWTAVIVWGVVDIVPNGFSGRIS